MITVQRKTRRTPAHVQQWRTPPMDEHRERHLLEQFYESRDPAIRDALIEANLRFVAYIVNNDYAQVNVDYDDLISAGIQGLIIAVERFNPHRYDSKLITYAVWWVRQQILEEIERQRHPVRIPASREELVKAAQAEDAVLAQRLGRFATPDELADTLEKDPAEIHVAAQCGWYTSLDGIGDYLDAPTDKVRLHPQDLHTPLDHMLSVDMQAKVQRLLDHLDDRAAHIVRRYYGIDQQSAATLEEIGQELGLTRERVRQIRNSALVHLRRIIVTQAV